MKNTIKMSLAAAVAVSAFSTSAFAGNLEEMIKGVEVSGYLDYRLENRTYDNGAGGTTTGNTNEYSFNVTATSKVNDIVSATVSAGFDEVQTDNNGQLGTITPANYAGSMDADPGVSVSNAYFTFDFGATTVMAGKQAIPSVFVDQVDTAKTGAGVVAVHKISDAITLAGAHFLNNNIAADTKTSELIAMGTVGPVNYAVNYNYTDISGVTETDRYSINVGATVGPVKIDVRHSAASTDAAVGTTQYEDAEVTKFAVSGKVGSVKLGAMYAMTNEQNDIKTRTNVAIDGDNDATAHAKVWQLSTVSGGAQISDADIYVVSADMPLMDKVTAGVTYGYAEYDATYNANGTVASDVEADELLFKLTYQMSKNFTIHGRYSILDADIRTVATGATVSRSWDYSRIQLKYTF